ncbi:MAG: hypothetical protein AAGF49_14730 [Pseudomonadota bacterium]
MTTLLSGLSGAITLSDTTPLFVTLTGIDFDGGAVAGTLIVAGDISGTRGIHTDGNDRVTITGTGTVAALNGGSVEGVWLDNDNNALVVAGYL